MADLIGQQFGNYRLRTLLGSGGFAEVYLGEHVRLGMQAAIKILHTRLEGEDAGAFQEEARTIAELIHPHIIRVLDFDLENGTPFLVLDYAPNGSLRQRHKRGERVPLEQIVIYVRQMADALQYAHDHKHVHRDVKPENMLLGRQNEILLTDFGIASIAHSTSSMNTEAPLGTLAYMSPEQIQGHARPASDQYALAITIYQWLTGVMPFRGSSAEVIGQQLGGTPPSPRGMVPEISPGVEQVVMTALAKDPRARFHSIHAFANAFEQASQGQSAQTTFSYTVPTVADARQTFPISSPPPPLYATPGTASSDPAPVSNSPNQVSQMPDPDRKRPDFAAAPASTATGVQDYTDAPTGTPSASYLRSSAPYIPPDAHALPRTGWIVFRQGLALGGYVIAMDLLVNFLGLSFDTTVWWFLVGIPSFLWGLWVARKTGLVRASAFTSLWGSFWSIAGNIVIVFLLPLQGLTDSSAYLAMRALIPNLLQNDLEIAAIGIVLAIVGGFIGRSIYRSRQPIHPPAGGSTLRVD